MNVYEGLDTVLLALLHDDIEDLHGVFYCFAVLKNEVLVDIGIVACGSYLAVLTHLICRRSIGSLYRTYLMRLAVHPGLQQSGGNGETDNIDTVIGDALEHIVNIGSIKAVCAVLRAVEAEPVGTCQPYLVSVHVIETAALCMEPVVVAVIGSRYCSDEVVSSRRCIENRACYRNGCRSGYSSH